MSAPRSAPGRSVVAGRAARRHRRDRRGRGARGPRALPGPLTPRGTPPAPSPAEEFDACVLLAAERLRRHVGAALDDVEIGVEETPVLPDDWDREVPLSAHLPAQRRTPARVVVYRLPVRGRVRDRAETVSFVLDLLVEEVADLVGRDPDELDPRLR